MKNSVLIILSLLLSSVALSGQVIKYEAGSIEYEDQPVQTIDIKLEPQVEDIGDKFERWIDDNYNVNLKDRKMLFFSKDVMTANKVNIPEVSDKKLDLRVKVDQTMNNATTFHLFASLGYDNWITEDEYPAEHDALKSIVYEFIVEYLPEFYSERIEDRKEIYGDLSDEMADLEKDIEANKLEIRENREEIEKMMNENEELSSKLTQSQRKLREAKEKLRMSKKEYKNVLERINQIKE